MEKRVMQFDLFENQEVTNPIVTSDCKSRIIDLLSDLVAEIWIDYSKKKEDKNNESNN